MNPKLKQTLLTLTTTLSAILIVTTATYAIGTLTPSGTVGDDTQVSLNDIYGALDDFSNHTVASTTNPFTVPEPVAASFHTLSEIYALISAESSDLVPENIADGVTVFGVAGTLEGASELMWSTEQGSQSWASATLACSLLTEGSVSAGTWRLPTRYELEAAIQEDWNGSSVLFAESVYYWSGTEYSSDDVWYAAWIDGVTYTATPKSETISVRCVR